VEKYTEIIASVRVHIIIIIIITYTGYIGSAPLARDVMCRRTWAGGEGHGFEMVGRRRYIYIYCPMHTAVYIIIGTYCHRASVIKLIRVRGHVYIGGMHCV